MGNQTSTSSSSCTISTSSSSGTVSPSSSSGTVSPSSSCHTSMSIPPVIVDLTEDVQPSPTENIDATESVQVKVEEIEEKQDPPKETPLPPADKSLTSKKKKKIPLYKRPHTIPAVCFSRLVKEISQTHHEDQYIWSSEAMQALQQCTEEYIEQRFRVCGKLTDLCKKQTLSKEIFDFTDTYLYQPVPAGFHE